MNVKYGHGENDVIFNQHSVAVPACKGLKNNFLIFAPIFPKWDKEAFFFAGHPQSSTSGNLWGIIG